MADCRLSQRRATTRAFNRIPLDISCCVPKPITPTVSGFFGHLIAIRASVKTPHLVPYRKGTNSKKKYQTNTDFKMTVSI
jgi:hypothetical protein